MKRTDEVWKGEALAKIFLEGVRRAVPLSQAQIEVMLRVVTADRPQLATFLDLGCGDGILGQAILSRYPRAKGVFLDFSDSMLGHAREKCAGAETAPEFVSGDFGERGWLAAVENHAPFDVVVSGFAIHHQPDVRKRQFYEEIFGVLEPGGFFLNVEHVSSSTQWLEHIFDEMFIDSLCTFHGSDSSPQDRERIAREYYHRPDKAANILAPLELQCDWLREIGYDHVDCYLKIFELALFGGMRSKASG